MTTKTDNEISNLFNYDKLKELCTEKGCHMPDDALSKIADTPMYIRAYYEKIGEIQERGKHETKIEKNVRTVVKKIVSCETNTSIALSDYCYIPRDMAVDLAILRFIGFFFDLKPSEMLDENNN